MPAEGAGPRRFRLQEATIAELQAWQASGGLTARDLVAFCLARIDALDRRGPGLRSVIETNPDAPAIAAELDAERRTSGPRGPLHGIPMLLKDNIDTADRQATTAGSLALLGSRPPRDATVAARLRAAGAVLIGKTNLSEWANFRSRQSSSGWSARGGQTRNPHRLDRSPSGSSSGSGVAVAAGLAPATLGTETDGSILSPASANGVVGLKPTVGLTSRAGVIPIAHSQDTVGPMCRTVADAATVLGALVGVDPRDPATEASAAHLQADYRRFVDPDGLRGARLGVARAVYFGYSEKADAVTEAAIAVMEAAGAVVVDPADIPSAGALQRSDDELTVLLYEFRHDIEAYLAERGDPDVRTLADLIRFNDDHAGAELPFFGQDLFLKAEAKGSLDEPAYLGALARNRGLAREGGIDQALRAHGLDALVLPSASPAWKIDLVDGDHELGGGSQAAAVAGYPAISVPAGDCFGLPVGVTFVGTAWSEPTLIRLAAGFERASAARRPPRFLAAELDL